LATGTPQRLDLNTKAQDDQYGPVPQVAFIILITPTTADMSHIFNLLANCL